MIEPLVAGRCIHWVGERWRQFGKQQYFKRGGTISSVGLQGSPHAGDLSCNSPQALAETVPGTVPLVKYGQSDLVKNSPLVDDPLPM